MLNFFISLFGQGRPNISHQSTGRDRRMPEMPIFYDKCNCTVKMMVW